MINLFFGLAIFVSAVLIMIYIVRDHKYYTTNEVRKMSELEVRR